jgi:hypothetical protein
LLADARDRNILRSTDPLIKPRCLESSNGNRTGRAVEWGTDAFELVTDAKSMVCHQAVLVAIGASTLQGLGITPFALPTAPRALTAFASTSPFAGADFHLVNAALEMAEGRGSAFLLRKPAVRLASVLDVFTKNFGCWVIFCLHYHAQDMGLTSRDGVEGIGHYIFYNAGTRMLQTYPEVLVLDQAEVDNPKLIYEKLMEKPYLLRLDIGPQGHSTVRQVFCYLDSPHLLSLPHSNLAHVRSYWEQRQSDLKAKGAI